MNIAIIITREYGAEVPFIRPAEVSDDYAITADVILHALDWFENLKMTISHICCLYATTPFIRSEDINNTYQLLLANKSAQYCFPICEFPFPIQRAVRLYEGNKVKMFQPENFKVHSQDLVTEVV
jgi:pseudaminic acid cytidylyltransferase